MTINAQLKLNSEEVLMEQVAKKLKDKRQKRTMEEIFKKVCDVVEECIQS